ncbi:hypothetical protein [Bdellovibrio bacteriovorus]|uniref:hypothetical protein n=1 Tax=Bdellovibrio TaxID=958 RepID=UPI0035A8A174
MKALLVTMTLVFASPVFANCVSEMMAGPARGNLDQAHQMCRKSEKVCNLSGIIAAHHGMNYAQAMEYCARKLESNAKLVECMAKGYNYSYCTQN